MKHNATAKHTILWADDDIDDRLVFREVLEDHAPHHEVIEFINGKQLFTYLQSLDKDNLPCLIVLDMNMPVLGGMETLAMIKQVPDLCAIPVVIFTTSANPANKNFCDGYQTEIVTKPPSYEQLKRTIEKFVEKCSGGHPERSLMAATNTN